MIRVVGPRTPKEPGLSKRPEFVNTTSRASVGWHKGLSPFFLGPVPLYPGAVLESARNVENAWQYAKVYRDHLNSRGYPNAEYFRWAKEGWSNPRAVRYPMGKGAAPEYSWWGGERLSYTEARKRIYVPCYSKAVMVTPSFAKLRELYRERGEIILWDFDGYDHHAEGMTLKEVLNDPDRKMGHGFVLAMLLEGLAKKGDL